MKENLIYPRELKQMEAVRRMKSMHIMPDAIKLFRDENKVLVSENPYGFMYEANEIQAKLITDFEAELHALVYHANLVHTRELGDLLSLFYVSNHIEEWEMDRSDLPEHFAFVYTINLSIPEFSEFGMIEFRAVNGGIKRIN